MWCIFSKNVDTSWVFLEKKTATSWRYHRNRVLPSIFTFRTGIVTFNEPSARSSSARASPWKTSDCCKSQISFNSKKWVGKKKLVKIWESFPNSWCTEIENCLKPLSSDEVFQHLCTNSGCFCLRFCLRNATDEELCRVEGCFAFSVQAYFGPYRPYQKLVQNKSRIHWRR